MSNETRADEIQFAQTIDTEAADLSGQRFVLVQRLTWQADEVRRMAGQKRSGYGENATWDATLDEALAFVPDASNGFAERRFFDAVDAYHVTWCEIRSIDDRLAVLDNVYSEHGWARFFLVVASNGHIHRATWCHTTYPTTQWAWLPHLSGLTEAEAVADQGEILCSVCYPSAPVAWTSGTSKADQAAKAERAAAKAEREAKRAAKALLPEDVKGGLDLPYVSRNSRTGEDRVYFRNLTTLAQAKTWLTDTAEYGVAVDGRSERCQANVDAVLGAYAARTGSTPEAEWEAAKKRAAKRR